MNWYYYPMGGGYTARRIAESAFLNASKEKDLDQAVKAGKLIVSDELADNCTISMPDWRKMRLRKNNHYLPEDIDDQIAREDQ